MNQTADNQFEAEVLERAEELLVKHVLAESRAGQQERWVGAQLTDEEERAVREALDIVGKPSIRERLCPLLTSVSEDLKDIAKVVTAGLLPLAISGALPKSALLFGAVAVVIVRAGISSMCPGEKRGGVST